jgi:hypothetical protein
VENHDGVHVAASCLLAVVAHLVALGGEDDRRVVAASLALTAVAHVRACARTCLLLLGGGGRRASVCDWQLCVTGLQRQSSKQ